MALNRELFQKIHDIITAEGGAGFQMANWEHHPGYKSGCGTTRCVAGWAIYLETGASLYEPQLTPDGDFVVTSETKALAARLRAEGVSLVGFNDFEAMGLHLLGLTDLQRRLFYASNGRAAEVVKAAAEGASSEEIDRLLKVGEE